MHNKNHQYLNEKIPPLHQLNQHQCNKDVRFNEGELENIIHTLQRIETKIDVLLMRRHHGHSSHSEK